MNWRQNLSFEVKKMSYTTTALYIHWQEYDVK
jgi:hypothetical protein